MVRSRGAVRVVDPAVVGFGVILWEQATGRVRWEGLTPMQVAVQQKRLPTPDAGPMCPEALRAMIAECFGSAEARPTFASLAERLRTMLRSEVRGASETSQQCLASFLCPITLEAMRDPVACADGHSYERAAIESWLSSSNASPMTGAPLSSRALVPNHTLRSVIAAHLASGESK